MKAECPQCGGFVELARCPEKGALVTCPTCGNAFDPASRLRFDFGPVHVTEEKETFVVEWQVRG
jgi:hypothetical protein